MKKQELLKRIDGELLEKLYGFCYARTNDGYEAQDLCSDIILALLKAANAQGEVENEYAYIWRVARNVYADFARRRRLRDDWLYKGDAQVLWDGMDSGKSEEESAEKLEDVYRRMAFLTRSYREVMIGYYFDGLSCAEIAKRQQISQAAVRQRLLSARKKIRDEVDEMTEMTKPAPLQKMKYHIWGAGNPTWGDPRVVCTRQLSKHIVWLCRNKAMSAPEIAQALNVPTVYVEEELEILAKGENGQYGLLRRAGNGKYAINFILVESADMEKAHALYLEQLSAAGEPIVAFIQAHQEEYLAFPYLNRRVDWNLVLWQQVFNIACAFSNQVERIILSKAYFSQLPRVERPFSVFGFVDNGKSYGGGWDSATAENVCGYASVMLENISVASVKAHLHCGLNIARDAQIQLALRAIDGLEITSLTEAEKEHAAKAVESGYLYREDKRLYTKILVCEKKDRARLFEISDSLSAGYFDAQAEVVAEKMARWITQVVHKEFMPEWRLANQMASLPVIDAMVGMLMDRGLLIPPENGIGAQGCWMSVEKA